MIGVIIASRKVGINPDNVATPIAASLGDLITLSLLAGVSTGLYKELGDNPSLPGRLDGALDVGPRHGPRQLLNPLPDCSG